MEPGYYYQNYANGNYPEQYDYPGIPYDQSQFPLHQQYQASEGGCGQFGAQETPYQQYDGQYEQAQEQQFGQHLAQPFHQEGGYQRPQASQDSDTNQMLPGRQSIMQITRSNLFEVCGRFTSTLQTIKEKCLTRLTEQRKSLISKYRRDTMHQQHLISESKRKPSYAVKQVHQEMLHEQAIRELIRQEAEEMHQDLPELSVDDWNREYDEIFRELNEHLARQLLESTQLDELYHYEKYQQINNQEMEHISQLYNPSQSMAEDGSSKTMYICAVCKNYVHRLQNSTRVCCERRGCIDIDLRFDGFHLEVIMNLLMKVLLDHREQAECNGAHACSEEKSIRVKVAALSEVGMLEDDQAEDSLVMFVTCEQCNFLDFVTLL